MKKKRNYIFTNRKHTDQAIMSVILGMISVVSTIVALYLSYRRQLEGVVGYGATCLLAAIFAVIGLVLALTQLSRKDTFRFFPVLGLVLNLVVLVGIGLMVYWGMQ